MFKTSTPNSSIKRVLIYRLGSLGDTVIALPALKVVANAFPQAERRLLTSFPPSSKAPPSSAIVENTGLIHGFVRYTYGTRSVRELMILWWTIARWRPEVLVYLSGPRGVASAKRDALFFRLCGIRRLIGVPITEDMQQNRRSPRVSLTNKTSDKNTFEPECARLTRNISELGLVHLNDSSAWDLQLTPDERSRSLEVLLPIRGLRFIAMSIGTKNQSNDWEAGNWHDLLFRLAKAYPDLALVICGAAVEFELSDLVAAGWREASSAPVLNLCGFLHPRETAAVFECAEVFIGHDSGPAHLAAAVQTPCVAIYGARNLPGIWFPFGDAHRVLYRNVECAGCQLVTCLVEKKKCILSITVDEVFEEVVNALSTKGFLGKSLVNDLKGTCNSSKAEQSTY